jgi:hypothetical protein
MEFTKHALEQMQERNISEQLVITAIESAIGKVADEDLTVFHYIYTENDKRYLLRVFVNETIMPHKVVTVYRTSKIDKYHES